MVTSLGPWNPEWKRYHEYSNGQGSRAWSVYVSELPRFLRQEYSFLKHNFPTDRRIAILAEMICIIKFERWTEFNKGPFEDLKILEYQLWWEEEEAFRIVNSNTTKAPQRRGRPGNSELRELYSKQKTKTLDYIPSEQYLSWLESHIILEPAPTIYIP